MNNADLGNLPDAVELLEGILEIAGAEFKFLIAITRRDVRPQLGQGILRSHEQNWPGKIRVPHFFVRPDEILDKVTDEFLQRRTDGRGGQVGQNKGSPLDGLYLLGDMGGTDFRLEPMADALAVSLGHSGRVKGNYRGTVGHWGVPT